MGKGGFRRGTMNENQRKSTFPHGGKSKIDENRLSTTGENQKSAKIGFPPRGKIKNQQKSAFRHGGKSKISENRLSLTGENQKTTKIGFPNIGKIKNRRKSTFPTLGRIKNAIGCISQLSERRKTPKVFYLTFGVRFILTHPLICCFCDSVGIQTQDLQNRNLTLYSAKLRSQSSCKITNKKLTVQMLFANLFCNLYDLSYLCDINIVGM